MNAMTPRERVVAALSHKQPDRVPLDLGSTRDSSIVVEGYERLRKHFGAVGPVVLTSRMMRVVEVEESILQALHIDTRGVFPASPPDTITGENTYRDEWGIERVRPSGCHYYDQVSFPLAGPITVSDIARYPWPDPHDPIRLRGLKEKAKEIHDRGYAAVLNLPSGFVHVSQYLRGFADWFADIGCDRKLCEALFDAVLDVNLATCRAILAEVGGDVDVLMASDDVGLQNGLMVSPGAYRDLIKPRQRKYLQLLHDMSPAKVFFHTCGSVIDIIEDLIEIGVDVLNPIQVSARGMDPAKLKRQYGDRLAFWGAIDTQQVLPKGSIGDVEAEVERRIEALGYQGGYILGAVHNIQPDVPLDNILAMYRHAREYTPSYSGQHPDRS